VLVDGDAVVYESAIINEYLDEKYPAVPLMPKEPLSRSRVRIWIDYCNTRLQRAGGNLAHGHEVEKSAAELKQYLATLNGEMRDREYIGDDNYSLGDITYIPFFVRLERYKATIDNSLPYLKAWMDRLLARPTVRATP
jgi:glutathione S-transferase